VGIFKQKKVSGPPQLRFFTESISDPRIAMSSTPDMIPDKANRRKSPGLWFWVLLCFIVSAVAAPLVVLHLIENKLAAAGESIKDLADVFNPKEVVDTFTSWQEARAAGNAGNILEVATAVATETFTRQSHVELFGKKMPLGTTVSEISVPATYRYHIDLRGDWELTISGQRLVVLAPSIRPSLPVAFDSAGIRKKSQAGWALWNAEENLAALESSISAELAKRAGQEDVLVKVREESRISVARFLQDWLLSRQSWSIGKFTEIVVIFPEESNSDPSRMKPTLQLEQPGEAGASIRL
jgi:hypothetical protein